MNVLSLFDGIAVGRLALQRAGIDVNMYFASEIKKSAIKVAKDNNSDIIHIGDVTKVKYSEGILYTEYGEFNVGKIHLLIGGSPCQDFSLLNVQGLGLEGSKSKLFYEYLRIKNEINPDFFLLENVKMKKDNKLQLDTYLNCNGIEINSNLFSYQNRPRIYWTNIKIDKIKDSGINFQDYKENNIEIQKQYKVKKTPSRIKMWRDGLGRNGSLTGCANVTNSTKIQCLTRKQDRSPNSGLIEFEDFCRYLTREELEQAQTLPIGYTKSISYNQAQDVLGDSWTVDVIVHILKNIVTEKCYIDENTVTKE